VVVEEEIRGGLQGLDSCGRCRGFTGILGQLVLPWRSDSSGERCTEICRFSCNDAFIRIMSEPDACSMIQPRGMRV
jgi:hypothetical protein